MLLVASRPCQDLSLFAKNLLVVATVVGHGLDGRWWFESGYPTGRYQ
jgi:hypothetical protein